MMKKYILSSAIFTLFAIVLQSCEKQDRRNADLIARTYAITESDPQQGLLILDSISNPSQMHQDLYMRYILIHNQVRYKCDQDISKDSLIFVAEKYFVGDDEANISALAHFCAANTHYEADSKDKALFCYSKAAEKAILAENNLIAGRSKKNIAYIYFCENIMDSTITNGKKGLYYYEKVENNEHLKMDVIALIGRAYEDKNSLDSAYSYFGRGLQLASNNSNLPMQAVFNHNIGVVMLKKNKLDNSIKCFHTALSQTSVTQDSLVANMHLSSIYMQKNRMDSARYYSKIIDNRIAEIQDDRTKKDMYEILSNFMQKTGDYTEAFRYLNLQYSYKYKILESNVSADLIKAHNRLIITNSEKESTQLRSKVITFVSILLISILIAGFIIYKKYKKLQQKNELDISTMNLEKEKKKFNDKIKKYQESEKQTKEEYEKDKLNAEADKRTVLVDSYLSINMLHKELKREWVQIDKRLTSLMATEYIESKPRFQQYMESLLYNLKEKRDTKLYELANDCVKQIRKGDEILTKFEYNDLVLLVLSNSNYSDQVIGDTLGIKAQFIITQRIELKYKLQKMGFTEEIIREKLFPDFKSKKSRV